MMINPHYDKISEQLKRNY